MVAKKRVAVKKLKKVERIASLEREVKWLVAQVDSLRCDLGIEINARQKLESRQDFEKLDGSYQEKLSVYMQGIDTRIERLKRSFFDDFYKLEGKVKLLTQVELERQGLAGGTDGNSSPDPVRKLLEIAA